MKKILTVLLSVVLIGAMPLAFTGCGKSTSGGGDGEKLVIHFGSTQGTTHAWYKAAEKFAKAVEEESNGNIEISIEFGGVNGSDKDHAEAVQNGSLDMYLGSTVGADAVVSKMGFVNLPYFINSYEQVDDLIYDGWVGQTIKKDMEGEGFKLLGQTVISDG